VKLNLVDEQDNIPPFILTIGRAKFVLKKVVLRPLTLISVGIWRPPYGSCVVTIRVIEMAQLFSNRTRVSQK
jgi:hypothetical protein